MYLKKYDFFYRYMPKFFRRYFFGVIMDVRLSVRPDILHSDLLLHVVLTHM